ncbi:MAG: hypothetical protein WC791_01790 [Candidatus Paceibacterota bacterium]|jgi:hypothetical protein
MEPIVPKQKLEPGVYQGTPESPSTEPKIIPRVIRTMKLDASEAIRNNEETTVSIAIAEQKKNARLQAEAEAERQAHSESVPAAPKPIGRIVVVIIILLVIGLLGGAAVFVLPKLGAIKLPSISMPSFGKTSNTGIASSTIPSTPALASAILTVDSENRFNVTNETRAQIFSSISSEKQQTLAIGFIKNMYFEETSASTTAAISANRFLMLTSIAAPEILTRSLERPFMVGFVGDASNTASPFIILKVSGSDTGLAGMLGWEATLPVFFDTVFGTSFDEGIFSSAKFKDVVILNKDVRMITSATGDSIVYSFANPTTIVITGSKSALETLLPIAASK